MNKDWNHDLPFPLENIVRILLKVLMLWEELIKRKKKRVYSYLDKHSL